MLLIHNHIFNTADYSKNIFKIADIAWALSNQCRWGGHTRTWFSVAEHSVRVSRRMERDKLCGLLHDASEYIYPDLPSPLAEIVKDYKIETVKLQEVIYKFFGIFEESSELKAADLSVREWEYDNYVINTFKAAWTPAAARFWFLQEFSVLSPES